MKNPRRLALICWVLSIGLVRAQEKEAPAAAGDLACAASVPIPVYQGIIWDFRVAGRARVLVSIGPDGMASSVSVEATTPLLNPWLKGRMRSAKFNTGCAGRKIEINFIYRLAGDPATEPKNEIRMTGPNTFEITAHPAQPFAYPSSVKER
jgi:hypothetical protein